MSTLAAARADNMYYPPEWRPEYGGISKFQGSNGHNQYEKYGKIRFELPDHGWCLGCGRHIGRGTRFNATKDQAGTYYSTKIWQFSMKCPSCSNVMVIKTDPKNTGYEYVEGIRKKDMEFDPEEAETQRVQDSEVSKQLAVDPLYRLEHEQRDKRRAASRKTVLTRLTELADAHAQDDYSSNARLRQTMRARKKKEREREEEATAKGLGIRLVTPSPADADAARSVKYRSRHKGFRTGEKAKMAAITGESIFGSGRESSEQARRKAVLVKASRLGLKTRGMRLLRPDQGSRCGDGELAATQRAPPRSFGASSCSRGSISGASACRHSEAPDGSRGSRSSDGSSIRRQDVKKRQRRPETAGAQGREDGAEGVLVGSDAAHGSGVVDGVGVVLVGEGERPSSAEERSIGRASRRKDEVGVLPPKKRRRKHGTAGGNAGNGGLAAIASLY
ncbi:unnamed protein product [Ectocarpus sp. 12 AP-2014]